jgi:hypothetical protein
MVISTQFCVAGWTLVQEFLSSHGQPEDVIADVCAVVASVGFKEELAKKDGDSSSSSSLSREAAVVQDADRCGAVASKAYSCNYQLAHHSRPTALCMPTTSLYF